MARERRDGAQGWKTQWVQNEMTFHNSVPAVLSMDGICHIMVFNSRSFTHLGITLVAIKLFPRNRQEGKQL